jgi:EAL domain-containing protein (putative c-di-GMP-specific phosphodiesterase class I)
VTTADDVHTVSRDWKTYSSAQLRELRSLNCEQGQGYLFSSPITREAVNEVLTANPVW